MANAQSVEGQPAKYIETYPTLSAGNGVALRVDANGNILARSVTDTGTKSGTNIPESNDGQIAIFRTDHNELGDGDCVAIPVDSDGYLRLDFSTNGDSVNASAIKQGRGGQPAIFNDGKKVQLSDGDGCGLQLTSGGAVRAVAV